MARAPILPSNIGDPTGTDPKVRQATAEFKRRIRLCRRAYLDLLERIEFDTITTNAVRYEFRTLPNILAQLLEETGRLVDQFLGADTLRNWFTVDYVIPAYEKGSGAAWRNLGVQSTEYAALRPTLTSLLQSAPYQNRIGLIRAREFELMKGLSANVKQGLSQQLTAGLAQGIGPREIAKNITAQTGIEERRAERIARTEVNQALRTARMDETQDASGRLGIRVKVMHLSALSPTTRATHAARSGQLYTVQEERDWFAEGGNAINCYLPGTAVSGRFVAGSKSRYEGPTVNLVAADGSNLTVTPNHPVMTQRGLVAAAKVLKTDYLLTYRHDVELPIGIGALNRQAVQPAIEQVFASLSDLGHTATSRVSAVDFHGDARFMDKNIQVVRADGALPCALDAQQAEILDELSLEHSYSVPSLTKSPQRFNRGAVGLTPTGGMGSGGVGPSLLGSHVSGPTQSPLAPVAGKESGRFKPLHDNGSADFEFSTDLLNRYTGKVALVKLIDIRYGQFSGHVYDLEEVSGLMVANGIIASNCKCSTSEVMVDEKGQPLSKGLVDRVRAASEKWKEDNVT